MLHRHLRQGLCSRRNLGDHHSRCDEESAYETPETQSFVCSPIGIKGCENWLHAKQKSGVRRTDQTLYMGLNQESEDGGKKNADDQGPGDLRIPNENRMTTPSGYDRTEQRHDAQLEGGEPIDIAGRGILSSQDDMPGNAHGAEGSEKVSLIDPPGSVRAQEKKTECGRHDSPSDIPGDRLSEEKRSHARNKDYTQSGQKTRIRSGRIVQGHSLKGVRSEEEDTKKDASPQELKSKRTSSNETKEKK